VRLHLCRRPYGQRKFHWRAAQCRGLAAHQATGQPRLDSAGPCATGDNTWICANVRLNGPPGYYVLAAVVVPADIAAHLRDTHEISSIPLGALGSTEITVNGEAS